MALLGWLFVRLVFFVAVAFIYEIVCCVVPVWFTYHQLLAKIFLCGAVSDFVFEMAKENIFKGKIKSRRKAVFISGCDSGFGHLAAKKLDSMGFHVFAGCYDSTQGGATELVKTCSEKLRLVQIDVTNDEAVQKAKHFIEQNLGYCELWAVVNNAGVYKGLDVEFTKLSDFRDDFEVNALGQVRVTKALLPLLKKSRGRVVNVNSIAGRSTTAHTAAYVMSKHAAVAFTECLRQEMDDWGIQVISVEPELFKTPMTSAANMRPYLQHILNGVDPTIKAEYGQEYLDKTSLMLEKTFGDYSSPRIERVTEAIEKAVSRSRPCDVYKPCGSLLRRVVLHTGEIAPGFREVFMKVVFYWYWGIPKPKMAGRIYR